MRHVFGVFAGIILAVGVSFPSAAQKIDANGHCHAADGKFAKMEVLQRCCLRSNAMPRYQDQTVCKVRHPGNGSGADK
jgi:hypothetical protein